MLFPDRTGQSAPGNQSVNPGVVPVGVVVVHRHIKFQGRHMLALRPAGGKFAGAVREAKLCQFGTQIFQRHPQIEKCRHGHIAGYSGLAIKINNVHVTPCS